MVRSQLQLLLEEFLRRLELPLSAVSVADEVIDVGNFGIQRESLLVGARGCGVVVRAKLSIPQTEPIQRLLWVVFDRALIGFDGGVPISSAEVFAAQHIVKLRPLGLALDGMFEFEDGIPRIAPLRCN